MTIQLKPDMTLRPSFMLPEVTSLADDGSREDELRAVIAETRHLMQQLNAQLASASTALAERTYLATDVMRDDVVPLSKDRRTSRNALPDPRLIRKILRHRSMRSRYFDEDLFADPAWDMILDLAAAYEENKRVPVTSLCIAARVPPTTALRWIQDLHDRGYVVREPDKRDKRRSFINLSEKAIDAVAGYFAEIALTGSTTA